MAFGLFPIVVSALAICTLRNRPFFIINEITRPIASQQRAPTLRRWLYSAARRLLYSRANLITANSLDGLSETADLIPGYTGRLVRLPNVIDDHYIAERASVAEGIDAAPRPYLICVGRLVPMKRVDIVIKAFAVVEDQRSSLVIVGGGPARHGLEALAERLGLRGRVIFVGEVANPFPLLNNALGFVQASEYEGFSNSVLEAMFCDVPVITSLCSSDSREMAQLGAALGFEVGDVPALADRMKQLANDETRTALIERAREYRDIHSLVRAVPVYEEAIRGAYEGKVNTSSDRF